MSGVGALQTSQTYLSMSHCGTRWQHAACQEPQNLQVSHASWQWVINPTSTPQQVADPSRHLPLSAGDGLLQQAKLFLRCWHLPRPPLTAAVDARYAAGCSAGVHVSTVFCSVALCAHWRLRASACQAAGGSNGRSGGRGRGTF